MGAKPTARWQSSIYHHFPPVTMSLIGPERLNPVLVTTVSYTSSSATAMLTTLATLGAASSGDMSFSISRTNPTFQHSYQ